MRHDSQLAWPPGFSSIRSISLGVQTCSSNCYEYLYDLTERLFLLPNLEYIYVDHPYSTPGARERVLPRRGSTVKHVHITSSELETNDFSDMIAGIVALKSFSLQSRHRNGCDIIRQLTACHRDSLEYLDMCDTDVLQRLHERYLSNFSFQGLTIFPNLKYLAVDLLVLLHQHTETRYARPGQLVNLKPHAEVERINLAGFLPPSLEYIAFKISAANYLLSTAVADAVSALVAKMIQSGAFPKLKAVFFEDIAPQNLDFANPMPHSLSDTPWFQQAIAAGLEMNVEVCTTWTHPGRQIRARKDQCGIPRATCSSDMRTDHRNG